MLAELIGNIPYGHSVVAHIGSLQFDRRNALHFRFRVLPEQPEWTATSHFSIDLGKRHWGRHTLQVQTQLASGPWSAWTEQPFEVLVPLWLSWQAFLAYGLAGAGIGVGSVQWRRRRRLTRTLLLPDLTSWRMKALSPETANLIGTVVDGRYEIGHILSIGGFATVVRARDIKRNEALCAVKLFRYEIGNQAWIRHRFEQEVEALEQLSHPNIVRVTAHGNLAEGAPYLVMEFIHGQNLRDRLKDGALPPRLIARFLRQLASALGILHTSLIYHRDLKPENLMIRSDADNEPQIVIIDFSIAIVKSPDQTFHGISRVAGTLEYMAPEQVIGYADATTDIYSLAKVFMEMLTGSLWADLLPEATLDLPKQVRDYLRKYQSLLTEASIDMIASALVFDPERRPQSVGAFAEPLIRDLEGAP
jgi:tRNA A-37 threonylcarbamoyl transferase component Bud32